MERYYKESDLLAAAKTTLLDMYDLKDFLSDVKPVEIREVVRCKNCIHCIHRSAADPDDIGCMHFATDYDIDPEHFCSKGEMAK